MRLCRRCRAAIGWDGVHLKLEGDLRQEDLGSARFLSLGSSKVKASQNRCEFVVLVLVLPVQARKLLRARRIDFLSCVLNQARPIDRREPL